MITSDCDLTQLNICIAGVGGVGGILGAALVEKYPNITFIARGERARHLREHGLITESSLLNAREHHPAAVVSSADAKGPADILLICVKNYQLETMCREIAHLVDEHTIVIPVMNGVDPCERTRSYLGKGIVLDSLIYVVAYANPDYSLTHIGNFIDFYIGSSKPSEETNQAVELIDRLFKPTAAACHTAPDIVSNIWKKYILNCAYNVITARYGGTIGSIRQDPAHVEEYYQLCAEAAAVGKALHVNLPDDLPETLTVSFRDKLSGDSTSSLQRDIEAGRKNELDTFCGHLIELGRKTGIPTPVSEEFYQAILERIPQFLPSGN